MDKKTKRSYVKSIDAQTKQVSGYVSTYGVDRDGERFVKGAWDLNDYLKNPVVLWSHDISQPPIAKTVSIVEDENGLKATMQFNEADQRSMDIFNMFQAGFLNAFSVGFIRHDFKMEDSGLGDGQKVLAITRAELYEYSAVSVPANPGARVTREIADMVVKTFGEGSIKKMDDETFEVQDMNGPGEGEEEKPAVEEPEESISPDLEASLKSVIELARTAKASPLDATKKALVQTAMTVFSELIAEKTDTDKAQLVSLRDAMKGLADVTAKAYPAAATLIQKTISQIDKALAGREG